MSVYQMTIADFLAQASSNSPTPGGGNVSAVVAALGASMCAMVASLTAGKKGYEAYQEQNRRILDEVMAGIEALKRLTQDDMDSFAAYMATFKLPKDTAEQKAARTKAIQEAAQEATLAPLAVCRKSLEIMRLAGELAPFGNKGAISDCGVAAIVLEGALKAAMLSVDINLPSIEDQVFVGRVMDERGRMIAEAEELKIKILAYMRERW